MEGYKGTSLGIGPNIYEILDHLGRAKYFSVFDLASSSIKLKRLKELPLRIMLMLKKII